MQGDKEMVVWGEGEGGRVSDEIFHFTYSAFNSAQGT